jgi:hypothetical protein
MYGIVKVVSKRKCAWQTSMVKVLYCIFVLEILAPTLDCALLRALSCRAHQMSELFFSLHIAQCLYRNWRIGMKIYEYWWFTGSSVGCEISCLAMDRRLLLCGTLDGSLLLYQADESGTHHSHTGPQSQHIAMYLCLGFVHREHITKRQYCIHQLLSVTYAFLWG